MAYKRPRSPAQALQGEALTSAMVGIGMNFAARAAANPNIEDTLLAASVAGMEQEDFRVLSMLMTWLDVHSGRINVDRLTTPVELARRTYGSFATAWQVRQDWQVLASAAAP